MAFDTHPQATPRTARHAAAPSPLLWAAALAALLPAMAGGQQTTPPSHPGHEHAGHEMPAANDDSAKARAARPDSVTAPRVGAFGGWQARRAAAGKGGKTIRAEQAGLRVDFTAAGGASGGGALIAGRDMQLSLRLGDARSGAPQANLELAGWIDRREELGSTSPQMCKAKVSKYVQSNMSMEGAIRARPVEDLNSYFILTLNRTPDIAVIDPFLGFGRTKLYTTVSLKSPGVDWTLSGDGRRLFVSMPAVGEVAVVDVGTWKVTRNVAVGGAPGRVMLSPSGKQLWVVNQRGAGATGRDTITVLDPATLSVAGRVPVGGGDHAIAFDDAGAAAFVTNSASGTVTIVDARRLAATAQVTVGARPTSVVYAAAARRAYVLTEGDGALVAVDAATRAVTGRVAIGPGARTVQTAPAMTAGHGGHGKGGHGAHGASAPAGRWLFVTQPGAKAVHIVDAAKNTILRALRFDHVPDQVGFTSSFAYVRFANSPKISMISLDDPTTGGFGSLDVFEAGQQAPGDASVELGRAIVAAPDMPDALYALNASEKMIYYYHYMEGMPIPSGGVTTYNYQPRAVLVAGKALRSREPGVYEATARLTEPGNYDLVLLVSSPRVTECFPFTVEADPKAAAAKPRLALRALPAGRALRPGATDTLRFELTDRVSGRRRVGLRDVNVLATATNGWRERAVAKPSADGTYSVALALPAAGVYYLSLEIPSLRITYNDGGPAILRASSSNTAANR
jgi:YVTN family beta-propeller protein